MTRDRRALFFRCLVLCTLGYIAISLLVKGSKSVTSWRDSILYKSDLKRPPSYPGDQTVAGSGAIHDFNIPPSNREKLLLKNDVTVTVFTYNEHWRAQLDIDKSPKRYSCKHSKRTVTVKAAYTDVEGISDADVIIFADSLRNKTIWDEVIRRRKSHQIWVYSTTESPYFSPQIFNDVDRPIGFGNFRFNASFTYHSFSSVVAPFGEYLPSRTPREMDSASVDYFKRKTRLVSWVSSHCVGQFWNRTEFVQSLAKLIPVDMYGRCGKRILRRGPAGVDKLVGYKFNLALENSCCLEYISEKLWHPLAYFKSVPVVIGPSRKDYERVAPPNSFIFAEDFKSIQDLAKYLRKVARNATLYNQFHEWRRHGYVSVYDNVRVFPFTSKESACALLEFVERSVKVNETNLELVTFDPFSSEFLGSCRSCGRYEWLRKFNTNPDPYHPTLRGKEHHH